MKDETREISLNDLLEIVKSMDKYKVVFEEDG